MPPQQKRPANFNSNGQRKKRKHASQREPRSRGVDEAPRLKPLNINRGFIEDGDIGIWLTCARGQEGKAAREAAILFDDHLERVYNIPPPGEGGDNKSEDGNGNDIAITIEKELHAMKSEHLNSTRSYTIFRVDVECVLFARTKSPIEPVSFCKSLCQHMQQPANTSRCMSRYLNRLSPVTLTGKATEAGLDEVARHVLAPFFELKPESLPVGEEKTTAQLDQEIESPNYSFAIRPSFRNHTTLKRDPVIKQVASLINQTKHKVDLTAPDKVILIDFYKGFVSMSVVDGDWEELRRYNLSELLRPPQKEPKSENLNRSKSVALVDDDNTTSEKKTTQANDTSDEHAVDCKMEQQ